MVAVVAGGDAGFDTKVSNGKRTSDGRFCICGFVPISRFLSLLLTATGRLITHCTTFPLLRLLLLSFRCVAVWPMGFSWRKVGRVHIFVGAHIIWRIVAIRSDGAYRGDSKTAATCRLGVMGQPSRSVISPETDSESIRRDGVDSLCCTALCCRRAFVGFRVARILLRVAKCRDRLLRCVRFVTAPVRGRRDRAAAAHGGIWRERAVGGQRVFIHGYVGPRGKKLCAPGTFWPLHTFPHHANRFLTCHFSLLPHTNRQQSPQ